ncbi:hypothetical protein ALNOE001_11510 [Candidatus Methanobinarius endosymbioticus]|uniref:ABC transmembrane type-2 domain-containing protein n=1 Tax=Candidatus Methanobinarius endosymbioticus TaxID=2006182 RepID=A0A366MBT7_9EURY|nr:hypothetical protein ALNOE001_11510 [Candidatus Methanobinarius endosymbioticus]
MAGIGIIMNKQYGFLKEIMVAPLSRASSMFGKALGIITGVIVQAIILLLLSFVVGVQMTSLIFIGAIGMSIIISIGFSGLGLFIASFMISMECFNLVMCFVIMPVFLLSGTVFPVTNLPEWLSFIFYLDPLTYGVDALRGIILGQSILPLGISIGVSLFFAILMILASAFVFTKKNKI